MDTHRQPDTPKVTIVFKGIYAWNRLALGDGLRNKSLLLRFGIFLGREVSTHSFIDKFRCQI